MLDKPQQRIFVSRLPLTNSPSKCKGNEDIRRREQRENVEERDGMDSRGQSWTVGASSLSEPCAAERGGEFERVAEARPAFVSACPIALGNDSNSPGLSSYRRSSLGLETLKYWVVYCNRVLYCNSRSRADLMRNR